MHFVAKAFAGNIAVFPTIDGFGQRAWNASDVGCFVAVANACGFEFQLMANAVQAASNGAGEGKVAIGIGARNATFHARTRTVANYAVTKSAIVATPCNCCWCP